MRLILLLCAVLSVPAATTANIPEWLTCGILQTETASHYSTSGIPVYVQRTGKDYGPFQLSAQSWDRLRERGLVSASAAVSALNTDMRLADKTAKLLILNLYQNEAKGDWMRVAAMWNLGPTGYRRKPTLGNANADRIKAAGEALLRRGPQ